MNLNTQYKYQNRKKRYTMKNINESEVNSKIRNESTRL